MSAAFDAVCGWMSLSEAAEVCVCVSLSEAAEVCVCVSLSEAEDDGSEVSV